MFADKLRFRTVAIGLMLAALAVAFLPVSSEATMPGRNGKILFLSDREDGTTARIYLLDPESGEVEGPVDTTTPYVENDYGWAGHWNGTASFSPDGSRIAWTRNPATCWYPPSVGTRCVYGSNIWVMNADGTNPVPVTPFEDRNFHYSASWSPDGSTIVYSRLIAGECSDLYTVTEDAAGQWGEPVAVATRKGCEEEAEFTPDGRKILLAYDIATKNRKYLYDFRKQHFQLFLMNTDGSGRPKRVTHTKEDVMWSTVSPDGRRVGFELSDNQGIGRGIYIIRVDGSGMKQISFGDDGVPAWSPDGKLIVFERGEIEQDEDLYTVSVRPPHRVRLVLGTPDWEGFPDWQPLP